MPPLAASQAATQKFLFLSERKIHEGSQWLLSPGRWRASKCLLWLLKACLHWVVRYPHSYEQHLMLLKIALKEVAGD